jgi:hypothetical protein
VTSDDAMPLAVMPVTPGHAGGAPAA